MNKENLGTAHLFKCTACGAQRRYGLGEVSSETRKSEPRIQCYGSGTHPAGIVQHEFAGAEEVPWIEFEYRGAK